MKCLALLLLATTLVGCGVKQPDGTVIDGKRDRANKEVADCVAMGGTAHMASRYDNWYGQVWETTCDVSPK